MKNARFNLRAMFWLIIGLYAVSFLLPVVRGPGLLTFVFGAILLSPCWLANPVFWCGLYLLAKRRWVGVLSVGTMAFLLALSALLIIPDLGGPGNVGLGYWVWLASMGLLSGAGLIGVLKRADQKG